MNTNMKPALETQVCPPSAGIRMVSAPLRKRMIVRLVEGARCPCGHALGCDPEALDTGFRIVCTACHQDFFVFESAQ
ncbi:hypothetical protein IVB18_47735 [Bradyrhizobium sp. 186]|uniref:hypothetical protein n=1 Tax=Bradyrhizobium sp. 186 TaxID=2782654 RepID=UPI0020009D5E|nr:hypothetical protein [Bradyrhizobium sp. 186]UPK35551.1 hypothetical protein IVB18_47735 [Bradyrhizobium sp. 186]